MMASLFELLFKVRPVAFNNGTFGFEAGYPLLILALALAIAAATTAAYSRRRQDAGARRAGTLITLRVLTVALLAFALLRPVFANLGRGSGREFPGDSDRRLGQHATGRRRCHPRRESAGVVRGD